MKYRQLEALVRQRSPDHDYILTWNETAATEAGYNIMPLPHGTYLVQSSSGRGGWYRRTDSDGLPFVFISEDDACDYVWNDLTRERPAPVAPSFPARPPEYYAEKARKLAAGLEARGPQPIIYPSEDELNYAIQAYFGLVGSTSGEAAVAGLATSGRRPVILDAVRRVLEEADSVPVEAPGATPGRHYRSIVRAIAGRRSTLDLRSLVALADRRFAASWPGERSPASPAPMRDESLSFSALFERLSESKSPAEVHAMVSVGRRPDGAPARYTFVPLWFGRYALDRALPGGTVYRELAADGRRLVFRNESDACFYLLERLDAGQ